MKLIVSLFCFFTFHKYPKSSNFIIFSILVSIIQGCGPEKQSSSSTVLANLFEKISGYLFPSSPQAIKIPSAGTLVTEILQPEFLSSLEKQGFRLSDVFSLKKFGSRPAAPYGSLLELSQKNSWYLDVVNTLSAEIDEHSKTDNFNIRADDDRNRLFDKRWLRSKDADFELVGLVNRIDQKDFHLDAAQVPKNCGELRLIYRLAYDKSATTGGFSRLPVTFNWVFEVPLEKNSAGKACVNSALKWRVPESIQNGEQYVQWLINGPLKGGALSFKQLEVNLQASRIVASNKPDLGGSATYFLMIFAPDSQGKMIPQPLRNTIDEKKIAASPQLRKELVSFISENLKEIDTGVYEIPEKFLATKSVSRTTHGLNRLANMPYGKVFNVSEFANLNYSGLKVLAAPQALLRRLDDGTCAGCHQGDSVAGFHILGFENPEKLHPLNATRVGYSPHFHSEMQRRKRSIAKLASGIIETPERPFSFQKDTSIPTKAGNRCIPQDASRFLQQGASFGCGNDSKLRCEILEDNNQLSFEIGTCVRSTPVAGDPCVKGSLVTNLSEPNKDTIANTTFACGGSDSSTGYVCLQPQQGVPGGLCYRKCTADMKAFSPENELCAYNGGSSFDACAASGDFSRCLLNGTSRGLRAACDENTPCREDYICQSFFGIDNNAKRILRPEDTRGYCVPTYFIFQLRLDGHPVP